MYLLSGVAPILLFSSPGPRKLGGTSPQRTILKGRRQPHHRCMRWVDRFDPPTSNFIPRGGLSKAFVLLIKVQLLALILAVAHVSNPKGGSTDRIVSKHPSAAPETLQVSSLSSWRIPEQKLQAPLPSLRTSKEPKQRKHSQRQCPTAVAPPK